jgi:FkbM family methyltransferase
MELFLYNSPAFENFLKNNPHERGEVKFLESIVQEGMNVMDIGANKGITTTFIANRIGGGKLYSFEPVPEYYHTLRKNLSSNGLENAKVYELAVADQVGKVDFYHRGLSSGIIFEEGAKRFEASATTVDTFLSEEKVERLDLINMDCEGSEFLVLKGAKETLRKNRIRIFCEVHHTFLRQLGHSIEEIVKYLKNLGFQVQSISLNDLKAGNNYEKCDYIYAHNLNDSENYAHLRM